MATDVTKMDPDRLLRELRLRGAAAGTRSAEEPGPTRAPSAMAPSPGLERDANLAGVSDAEIADALRAAQKVIYGTDDRQEVFALTDEWLRRDAASVVALVRTTDLVDNGDDTFTLKGPTLGERLGLCADEPFRSQPTIAFCSGFLVDPSIVVTAAHCVDESDLDDVRFVFGYEMSDATTAETTISSRRLHHPTRILGRAIGNEGTDWCVIQLAGPVLDHPHVRVRRHGAVPDDADVHVIGHPSGLPKKVAGDAVVRDNSSARFFVANLDTYGGNSGSPVFNSGTHRVEGILVRGETDYVSVDGCVRSNVCPADGCRGEDVTRSTEFADLVPRNHHDFVPFDPASAQVVSVRGRWKIEVDQMWLLDFAEDETQARRALEIIQHYRFNLQCFVGRPHPRMQFYLVNGRAPTGSLPGESCVGFDPDQVEVQHVAGRWTLMAGAQALLDFDQEQDDARQALSYILRYRFRSICFLGSPDSSFMYFKG